MTLSRDGIFALVGTFVATAILIGIMLCHIRFPDRFVSRSLYIRAFARAGRWLKHASVRVGLALLFVVGCASGWALLIVFCS